MAFPFMGNLFPHTDYNKINLDWILDEMKQDREDIDEIKQELENITTDIPDYSIENIKLADRSIDTRTLANDVKLRLSSFVTPEQFGAVGDGVADDTIAVATAFTHPYVILSGVYLCTAAITSSSNIIIGQGEIKTAYGIVFTHTVSVSGITITMPSQGDVVGLEFQHNCYVDAVMITGGRQGILVNNNYKNCVITNSKFTGMWGNIARAISNEYTGKTYVAFNTIENVSNNIDQDADGVSFWQNVADTATQYPVAVVNNYFHNCRGRFVKMQAWNSVVSDNVMVNDADFDVITYFHAIDIQKGSGIVENNTIIAQSGINVSYRDVLNPFIVIRSNHIVKNTTSSRNAISFSVYDAVAPIVYIEFNTIDWGDFLSVRPAYTANAKYVIKHNRFLNRSGGDAITPSGTADISVRFIVQGNTSANTYVLSFSYEPNVLGDETVRCTKDIAAGSVINHTKYVANGATLMGHGYAMLETHGNATSTGFVFSLSNAYGMNVYDREGNQLNV